LPDLKKEDEPMYEFKVPTRVIYGRDSAARIGEIAAGLPIKKALLVTDSGVAKSGVVERLLAPLQAAGVKVSVFDHVEYNPTIATADKAFSQYSRDRCDGVIAVGGGSPMDVGKCVGVLATNAGSAADYLGMDKVKNPAAPVICVPTTAGTAAEITDVAVLTDPAKQLKIGLRSAYVTPTVALLDPMLTISLPPAPTRDSGLDALTHAIESYICINAWPATEALTLRAIELIGRHLRTAVHNGRDIDARDGMLTASLLAGLGFHQTKLCLVHAITIPLGGIYNMPHGVSNAIVLPHAMEFMLPGAISKYVDLAVALGEDVSGLSERVAAEQAVEAVRQLCCDVDLPKGLSVYGAKEEDLPKIAEAAHPIYLVQLAPRVATVKDIEEICRKAL
jgi:alcohol dehydrogenase